MSTKFKDNRGREWTVVITGETISEAWRAGIDLDISMFMNSDGKPKAINLANFKVIGQLLDICWLACRHHSRVKANRVREEEFKAELVGDAFFAAVVATVHGVAECFGMKVELTEADPTDPPAAEPEKPSSSPAPTGAE
jgi:hypothetical protein